VQLQQSSDIVDQFVPFSACSVDGVWTVETAVDDTHQLIPLAETVRLATLVHVHEDDVVKALQDPLLNDVQDAFKRSLSASSWS